MKSAHRFLIIFASIVVPYVVEAMVKKEANEVLMNNKHIYYVILAGGNGERLWPLSRRSHPKQLLSISGSTTLLEQALERIEPLAFSVNNIVISTTSMHEKSIYDTVKDRVGTIIVEPASRNTGPAFLYCCYRIKQKDPDAVVIFLPSDAFIPTKHNHLFINYVRRVLSFSQQYNVLALLGIEPTFPATGYGYIEFDSTDQDETSGLYKVISFHEKPSAELANCYWQAEGMLWNIGMFAAKVSVLMSLFEKHAPELFEGIDLYIKGQASYNDVPSISIDYAVIEKSNNVWVLPTNLIWNDVGNISVFLSLQQQYGMLQDNTIAINAHNNLVYSPGKLVALIGLDNVCVVQTEDALLITKRDESELVKMVVQQLEKSNYHTYL